MERYANILKSSLAVTARWRYWKVDRNEDIAGNISIMTEVIKNETF